MVARIALVSPAAHSRPQAIPNVGLIDVADAVADGEDLRSCSWVCLPAACYVQHCGACALHGHVVAQGVFLIRIGADAFGRGVVAVLGDGWLALASQDVLDSGRERDGLDDNNRADSCCVHRAIDSRANHTHRPKQKKPCLSPRYCGPILRPRLGLTGQAYLKK